MKVIDKSEARVKFIAGKDLLILLKKLLITIALYLIPVLLVWASLTLVQKWRPKSQPAVPKTETVRVVDI